MAKKLFDFQDGEQLEIPVLIKSADVRIAKNGKKFIAFTFEDESGQITGKYWNASEPDIERFQTGKVVHLKGKRERYQGNPQIKIYQLKLVDAAEQDAAAYVPHAPEKKATMQDELQSYVFEITNADWSRVVRTLLKKNGAKFFEAPAAKTNHHAFEGGLAYHTLSILKMAKSVSDQYPQLNRSLLYAGAILHDMGKVIELTGPISTTYSLAGNLIGHIVLIDEEIVLACQELKIDIYSENMLLLRHVVLAHHGLLEYGSPERPKIMEAEVLHDLDDMDASITMMSTALQHTDAGEYTERLFAMDGRTFYRPHDKPQSHDE
ncbi:HDIG domain protein [Lactobacillus selangorensis]|uniref:HDIG domain protein n=1 Tax=Lactobacillus selangorensis TaxID=81857 RepID=A0A0R2FXR4_9LACO|nr:OB-fold nucleic acid binding domain-containing protein [Lactobacillus selangorensis]KRN29757.1 HDIG domain protein [Lactobacillus selangorensis]KRN33714.1 HDIG domain protein [Lactobacillus selangorensis]